VLLCTNNLSPVFGYVKAFVTLEPSLPAQLFRAARLPTLDVFDYDVADLFRLPALAPHAVLQVFGVFGLRHGRTLRTILAKVNLCVLALDLAHMEAEPIAAASSRVFKLRYSSLKAHATPLLSIRASSSLILASKSSSSTARSDISSITLAAVTLAENGASASFMVSSRVATALAAAC